MRHADPLEIHPLRTEGAKTTLLARFCAGWARRRPVLCAATEEFVVLDGSLEVNGSLLGPGSVAHVPAGAVRATTTSAKGCTAVAWFAGPLQWETVEPGSAAGRFLTWHPGGHGRADWATPLATWSLLVDYSHTLGHAPGDAVDLDEPSWASVAAGERSPYPPDHRVLRRTPQGG